MKILENMENSNSIDAIYKNLLCLVSVMDNVCLATDLYVMDN